jgi:hypothetical protein
MAIYLKKFENHTQYETYKASTEFITPNVSLCVTENEVHYNPFVDPYNGHAYVEIGGLKWATMNIGANSVTDYGLYFQWGDTQGYTADQVGSGEGKKAFNWADYKFNPSGDGLTMSKYNATDGKTVLEAADDAAVANWGGDWRMPTTEEYVALANAVKIDWTADYQGSGVPGLVCRDKDDSSKVLFFPAVGFCTDGGFYHVDKYGFYWSSSLDAKFPPSAYSSFFGNDETHWGISDGVFRAQGFAVRPVVG